MKKLIMFILMLFTIPLFKVEANTNTYFYNLIYTNDYTYSLVNGSYQNVVNTISTNRLKVTTTSITVDSQSFNSVLFWSKPNQFIGYYNSYDYGQPSNTDKYLLELENNQTEIFFPQGATLFAFIGDTDTIHIFQSFDVYYEYTVVPNVTLPISTRIDNYLYEIGLNTSFGKTLLVVIFMVSATILLSLLNSPKPLLILVNVSLFIMFSVFGWVQLWIIILLAIIILLVGFIALKGSGGGVIDD